MSKAAKTFEQNSRELTTAAQDANTRFNASINNNSSGSNTSKTTTGINIINYNLLHL